MIFNIDQDALNILSWFVLIAAESVERDGGEPDYDFNDALNKVMKEHFLNQAGITTMKDIKNLYSEICELRSELKKG